VWSRSRFHDTEFVIRISKFSDLTVTGQPRARGHAREPADTRETAASERLTSGPPTAYAYPRNGKKLSGYGNMIDHSLPYLVNCSLMLAPPT
jgi:hypothetical protein